MAWTFGHFTKHLWLQVFFFIMLLHLLFYRIVNHEHYTSFYTKHIDYYVQNKAYVSCSEILICERSVMIYYVLNVYLLQIWPLSSRADNHHYNIPISCHNSQSCCSFPLYVSLSSVWTLNWAVSVKKSSPISKRKYRQNLAITTHFFDDQTPCNTVLIKLVSVLLNNYYTCMFTSVWVFSF